MTSDQQPKKRGRKPLDPSSRKKKAAYRGLKHLDSTSEYPFIVYGLKYDPYFSRAGYKEPPVTKVVEGEPITVQTKEVTHKSFRLEDKAEFIKVFTANMIKFDQLSVGAIRVITYVMENLVKDQIEISIKYKSVYGDVETGRGTFYAGLFELCQKKILARKTTDPNDPDSDHTFFVNINYLYVGNRTDAVKKQNLQYYESPKKTKSATQTENTGFETAPPAKIPKRP